MAGSFGFKGADLGDDQDALQEALKDIKPRTLANPITPELASAAAAAAGFESREALTPVRRVKDAPLPMQAFNMRLPITVVQRFMRFADAERLSYPKAFALLLDRLGL